MAQRRMMSMDVGDTDAFLQMPLSSQGLYFHLNLRADDDGFVAKPHSITRMVGANEDDLKLLVAKRFILMLDNDICVIKHWRISNEIKSDRYHETKYMEHKKALYIKKNGAYTQEKQEDAVPVPMGYFSMTSLQKNNWIQPGYKMESEVRLGKASKGKVSKDKTIKKTNKFTPPKIEEVTEYCKARGNGVDPNKWFNFYESKGWMVGRNKMKNWQAAVRTWEKGSNKPTHMTNTNQYDV